MPSHRAALRALGAPVFWNSSSFRGTSVFATVPRLQVVHARRGCRPRRTKPSRRIEWLSLIDVPPLEEKRTLAVAIEGDLGDAVQANLLSRRDANEAGRPMHDAGVAAGAQHIVTRVHVTLGMCQANPVRPDRLVTAHRCRERILLVFRVGGEECCGSCRILMSPRG